MGQRSLGPRQRGHRVWAPGTRAYDGDHGHPASSSKTYETNCPSGNPSMVSSDWEGQVTLHWRPAWGSKALALGIWDGKASLWDTGMGRENLMAPTGSLVSDLNFAMFVYVPGGPGLWSKRQKNKKMYLFGALERLYVNLTSFYFGFSREREHTEHTEW